MSSRGVKPLGGGRAWLLITDCNISGGCHHTQPVTWLATRLGTGGLFRWEGGAQRWPVTEATDHVHPSPPPDNDRSLFCPFRAVLGTPELYGFPAIWRCRQGRACARPQLASGQKLLRTYPNARHKLTPRSVKRPVPFRAGSEPVGLLASHARGVPPAHSHMSLGLSPTDLSRTNQGSPPLPRGGGGDRVGRSAT